MFQVLPAPALLLSVVSNVTVTVAPKIRRPHFLKEISQVKTSSYIQKKMVGLPVVLFVSELNIFRA